MKKTAVLGALTVLTAAASSLPAQELYWNFGWINQNDFAFNPLVWTLGASYDFRLGEQFFLSGEADLGSYKLKFRDFWFMPGIMFNVRMNKLFVGAGLARYFAIAGDWLLGPESTLLKFNIGLQGRLAQIRLFFSIPFSGKTWMFGLRSGVSF